MVYFTLYGKTGLRYLRQPGDFLTMEILSLEVPVVRGKVHSDIRG